MSINLLNLPLEFLNWVTFWANYKIHLAGPGNFTIPLAVIGMLGVSLLVLILYSIREFRKRE